jgi:hypothetical protein
MQRCWRGYHDGDSELRALLSRIESAGLYINTSQ